MGLYVIFIAKNYETWQRAPSYLTIRTQMPFFDLLYIYDKAICLIQPSQETHKTCGCAYACSLTFFVMFELGFHCRPKDKLAPLMEGCN
jgi:hypothetical protein